MYMKKRTGGKPSAEKHGREAYVPDAGDLVWLSFSPQAGREQAGRRPALVLSPRSYNSRAGLCVLCPVTSHAKDYPFEVALPEGTPVTGVVLSDHIKSADWRARSAEHAGTVPSEVLAEVRAKLKPLLGT
jgi:mRNA interferase MazF